MRRWIPSTINGSTFILKKGSQPVSGTVTYAGVTATFKPTAALAPNTVYTATITTGAKDLAGNALASDFVWSFTTGAAPDTTAPTVTLTVPANAATGVAINQKIAATFSEAMNPSTITTTTFTLKQGATPVAGTVTYAGTTATFAPVKQSRSQHHLYRHDYNRGQGPGRQSAGQATLSGALPPRSPQTPPHPP